MNLIEEVMPDIRRAAKKVADKWPSITTQEDMVQTLTVHFLEAPGALRKLAELTPGKRMGRLVGIGHDKASGERDALDVFTGQFSYSVDEVRKLLERGGLDGQVDGFNSAVADLEAAYGELQVKNAEYGKAIWDRYALGILPVRKSADARRLERSVDSLTVHMNRVSKSARYEYLNGGRKRSVLTNPSAISVDEHDYEGVLDEDLDTDPGYVYDE
jgi:hypothetical protein